MNLNLEAQKANGFGINYAVSYKSYNYIKKKAMEKRLNWGSLIMILSVAFFVVALSAWALSLLYLGVSG